jgi:endogenous inhibitor of DNA gyrase (YacG/DUF329 family)
LIDLDNWLSERYRIVTPPDVADLLDEEAGRPLAAEEERG